MCFMQEFSDAIWLYIFSNIFLTINHAYHLVQVMQILTNLQMNIYAGQTNNETEGA